LENLLEAVKRDDSLQNSLILYRDLDLLDFTLPPDLTEEPTEAKKSPWPSSWFSGGILRNLWNHLQKVALNVMEIVANAIKVVPKLIAIKPAPSIGLSGAFPTFSLEFDLEAESITIHELFHELTGSLGQ
jgi:hypothetical protein